MLELKKLNKNILLIFSFLLSKLTDNFNSDVEAGHLASIGVLDGGVSVVSAAGQEPGDEVGDLGDGHGYWRVSSVGAGVEGSGTGLTLRNVSRAEEVRELVQQVVSLVLTRTDVQTLNLQARDGKINNAFLHDVEGDLGAGRDGGGEGEGGGDGHGGAGLHLHGKWLHISSVD